MFFDSGVDSASISVDVRRRLLFCFDDAVVGADALRCGCAVLDSASLIVGSLSVSALSSVSSSGADSLSSPDDTPRLCIVGADAECVA